MLRTQHTKQCPRYDSVHTAVLGRRFLAQKSNSRRSPSIRLLGVDAFVSRGPRAHSVRGRSGVFSNAFTSAFNELEPIPQFKATAKLGEFLEARFSIIVLAGAGRGSPPLPIKCPTEFLLPALA